MSRTWWRWWAPAWIYTLILFVFTSLPKVSVPDLGFNAQDKLYHLLAYALLTWLWLRALVRRQSQSLEVALSRVVAGALVYALFDEVHQEFILGRYGDVLDWSADAVGILAAAGLFYLLHRKKAEQNVQNVQNVQTRR
ncbi:VanZ family protein [candidate division KSB1 bacterium]|nr:VanZ family protein [candidate division KSB1 bacterium]